MTGNHKDAPTWLEKRFIKNQTESSKNSKETNNCPPSTLNNQKKMMKDHISKISAL